jgi:hypothetical protein
MYAMSTGGQMMPLEWIKEQEEALAQLKSGGSEKLLHFICTTYHLGTPTDFRITSTDDYGKVAPDNPAPGKAYGATVPASSSADPPTIFIHEYWINQWMKQTNHLGNLITTIRHESVHAKQFKEGRGTQPESVKEFEAYAEEIQFVIDASRSLSTTASPPPSPSSSPSPSILPLPTEAQMQKAFSDMKTSFANILPGDQPRYQRTLDSLTRELPSLLTLLRNNVSTKDYEALFKDQYLKAFEEFNRLKADKVPIQESHDHAFQEAYTALTRYAQQVNSDSPRQRIFDLCLEDVSALRSAISAARMARNPLRLSKKPRYSEEDSAWM